MSALLNEFEQYLIQEKHSPKNTRLSYLRDLRQLEQYLLPRQKDLLSADTDDVNAYFDKLKADGKAAASVIRAAAALKGFYHWLLSAGRLKLSPARLLYVERPKTQEPEILTEAEIRRLLEQPCPVDAKGIRNQAMLMLLCTTGMRITELIALNIADVRADSAAVHCGTFRNERTLILPPETASALAEYLHNARHELSVNPQETALFLNFNGERMTRQGFWKLARHYAVQAGLDEELSPRTIRHSFAIHCLKNGTALRDLPKILGHMDETVTRFYANWLKTRRNDT